MLGTFLSFLAWAGLYRVSLEVLNGASQPWTKDPVTPKQAADITATFMETLVDEFVTEDGKKVSYLALEQNPFFKVNFREFRSMLKVIDPVQMEEQDRKSFFINLYNILTIDALVSMSSLPKSTISVVKFWSRYAYEVGPYTLHLDDIEHGVLRGNRHHPTQSSIMFESGDPRLNLRVQPDHKIHSALNCGAMSCPPLKAYKPENLQDQLEASFKEFCNQSVSNINGSSITINSIFDWFAVDFSTPDKSTLKLLSECVDDPDKSRALRAADKGTRKYTFAYDWTLNAFSGSSDDRVKVTVYLQSLCSDTVRFYLRQLYPTWQELKDIIDLEFVPYGKARATPVEDNDFDFECQHGADECYGNLVMTCAQVSLPIATQVEFFKCMYSQRYPAFAGRKCSGDIGIDWKPLDECSKSKTGSGLLYMNGIRTAALKPKLHFIPTIVIDGHYDNFQLRTSLMGFRNQICSMYKGPPHQNCL